MCSAVNILDQEESALGGKKKPLTCCKSIKYELKHGFWTALKGQCNI